MNVESEELHQRDSASRFAREAIRLCVKVNDCKDDKGKHKAKSQKPWALNTGDKLSALFPALQV